METKRQQSAKDEGMISWSQVKELFSQLLGKQTVDIILGNSSVVQEYNLFETCCEKICPKYVLYGNYQTWSAYQNSINLIHPPTLPLKKDENE